MCLCEKLIISVVFCAICYTNIILSIPNTWPKMRNYDIWETTKSTKHEQSHKDNSYTIDNTANFTSSRDGRGKKVTFIQVIFKVKSEIRKFAIRCGMTWYVPRRCRMSTLYNSLHN